VDRATAALRAADAQDAKSTCFEREWALCIGTANYHPLRFVVAALQHSLAHDPCRCGRPLVVVAAERCCG
jgi:hypothetical protein